MEFVKLIERADRLSQGGLNQRLPGYNFFVAE